MKKLLLSSIAAFTLCAGIAHAAPVIGEAAPNFSEKDTSGKERTLAEFKGKLVVLEWKNHECPFVKKHYSSGNMQKLQKDMTAKDVVWLSVVSSATGKQGHTDGTAADAIAKQESSSASAILLDEDGSMGIAYDAKTTPHMFVIDTEGKLAYAGAIDDKPTTDAADIEGANNYVSSAVENLLAGKAVEPSSTQPYGCGVKY